MYQYAGTDKRVLRNSSSLLCEQIFEGLPGSLAMLPYRDKTKKPFHPLSYGDASFGTDAAAEGV